MKIFYNPQQSLDSFASEPSLNKPALLIEALKTQNLNLDIVNFTPLSVEQIKQCHDCTYVDNIMDLKSFNGFGLRDKAINQSLLWTNGSLVAAALEAHRSKEITFSPTSGFHHSMYAQAGGFCTFNDLPIAPIDLSLVSNQMSPLLWVADVAAIVGRMLSQADDSRGMGFYNTLVPFFARSGITGNVKVQGVVITNRSTDN